MHVHGWRTEIKHNLWAGTTEVRHLRVLSAGEGHARVYTEVYHLNGRLYWTANIHIPFRPDLSGIAYGMLADIPSALPVAKMRASRLALAALREAETHTLAA